MSKVTVIGNTSSGKTSFLYAMYNFIAMGYVPGFTICSSDVVADKQLQEEYERLADRDLGKNRFPQPSQIKDDYSFSLQYGFKTVADFEWADYPGSFVKEKEDALIQDLAGSDAWVIFLDGEKLTKAIHTKDENIRRREIMNECGKYNKLITAMSHRGVKVPQAVPVIITKSDVIDCIGDNWPALIEVVKNGLAALFSPMSECLVSISPVTLGDEIAGNDYRGELDPVNIEYPITLSMLSILNHKFDEKFKEIAYLKSLIEEDYEKFWSSAKRRSDWQSQIDAMGPQLIEWQKMAEAILNTLSQEKKMWRGGEELSMIDFYRNEFLLNQ